MKTLEQQIDELWDAGKREPAIARRLRITQRQVLLTRQGKKPRAEPVKVRRGCEVRLMPDTRIGPLHEVRYIPVTLAWTGASA